MFRLQWLNSSGDRRSPSELLVQRLQGTEAPQSTFGAQGLRPPKGVFYPLPAPTVPLPTIRRKQIQQLPSKSTTFFQNTSMLQRIDPRLNNTKCMSCGQGAV